MKPTTCQLEGIGNNAMHNVWQWMQRRGVQRQRWKGLGKGPRHVKRHVLGCWCVFFFTKITILTNLLFLYMSRYILLLLTTQVIRYTQYSTHHGPFLPVFSCQTIIRINFICWVGCTRDGSPRWFHKRTSWHLSTRIDHAYHWTNTRVQDMSTWASGKLFYFSFFLFHSQFVSTDCMHHSIMNSYKRAQLVRAVSRSLSVYFFRVLGLSDG